MKFDQKRSGRVARAGAELIEKFRKGHPPKRNYNTGTEGSFVFRLAVTKQQKIRFSTQKTVNFPKIIEIEIGSPERAKWIGRNSIKVRLCEEF